MPNTFQAWGTDNETPEPEKIPDKPVNLHFYKCNDCLSVITSPEYFSGYQDSILNCICGGRFKHLGQAGNKSRIYKTSIECACDGRCTGATGPKCECSCGGINHGTGRTVTITRDKGNIPSVNPPDPQAIERAREYRELRDFTLKSIRIRYGWVNHISPDGTVKSGDYPYQASDIYYARINHEALWNKYSRAKNHLNRMKGFRSILSEIGVSQ